MIGEDPLAAQGAMLVHVSDLGIDTRRSRSGASEVRLRVRDRLSKRKSASTAGSDSEEHNRRDNQS